MSQIDWHMICNTYSRITRILRNFDLFEFINYSSDKIIILLLVIIRTSGLFIMAPVLSDKGIPKLIKIGLIVMFGLLITSIIPNPEIFDEIKSNWQLASLVFNEILIGFIIGLIFRLIFYGVLFAGSIIGYQIGFMFAQVFDQTNQTQISIIGRFWYILALLFFLTINGHHLVINGLVESFTVIPPGNFQMTGAVGEMMMKYSAYIFVIAFKLAAPVIITLYLTDIALGTIAKTMPTMNVFFVGMPMKIIVGLIVMGISLPMFTYVIEQSLHYFDDGMRTLLYSIGKV